MIMIIVLLISWLLWLRLWSWWWWWLSLDCGWMLEWTSRDLSVKPGVSCAGNVLNFQIPGHCQTVVGNIPYRISSALISKLLRQEPPLERIAASQNGMELDGVGRWEQLCFDSHVKCLFPKCPWHHPSGMLNRQVDSNCHPYNLRLTTSKGKRRHDEAIPRTYTMYVYNILCIISFIYRSRCIYILHVPLMDYKL